MTHDPVALSARGIREAFPCAHQHHRSGSCRRTGRLALTPRRIFVAELFGNRISQINTRTGIVSPVVGLFTPAAVDFHRGELWTTYGIFGPGSLSRIDFDGPYVPFELNEIR